MKFPPVFEKTARIYSENKRPITVIADSENNFTYPRDRLGHKVVIYRELHGVFPFVGIGTPLTPLPQASVPSPPPKSGGGTLACGCGGGGVPVPTTGEKA